MTTNWSHQAACAGQPIHLFYSHNSAEGQRICHHCPVRAECLYEALRHEPTHHRYGIWGGLTTTQRQALPALPDTDEAALAELRRLLTSAPDQPPHGPTTHQEPHVTIDALRHIQDETTPGPRPPAPVLPHRAGQLATLAPKRATAEPPAPPAPADTTAAADTEQLSVGKLLAWGRDHDDKRVQALAEKAHDALAALRARHAADSELAAVDAETAELQARLAELEARRTELAPKGGHRKASRLVRDYDPATVRAWAREQAIEVPSVGLIRREVVDAWKAAQGA